MCAPFGNSGMPSTYAMTSSVPIASTSARVFFSIAQNLLDTTHRSPNANPHPTLALYVQHPKLPPAKGN